MSVVTPVDRYTQPPRYRPTVSGARICFVSLSAYGYFEEDAPAGGGAQRQFYLLSTALADRFDVHFVVGDYGQPRVEHREGVTLHRAYRPDADASTRERVGHLYRLERAIARADADIYLARSPPRKLAVLYALLALHRSELLYHVPTDAYVTRPVTDVTGLRARLYGHALQNCRLVAQTPRQSRLLDREWGRTATVVPNGYPPASVVDMHAKRRSFLWVGRLAPEKRPHLFLDIAARCPDQQFRLVGPPGNDDAYLETIRERGAQLDNVTLTGRLAPSAVHDEYRRAIALVNTSEADREGFPNTFLEAWRYATPVLGLAVDPGRFLDAPGTGYAGGEMETLLDGTRRLADDIDHRRRLGVKGMETFDRRYHLQNTVTSYVEVLEEVL